MKIMFQCFVVVEYLDWDEEHCDYFYCDDDYPVGKPFETLDEAKSCFTGALKDWISGKPYEALKLPEIKSLFIRPVIEGANDIPMIMKIVGIRKEV